MAGKIDITLPEAEQAVKTFCEIYDSCSFVKPGPDLFEITVTDGEKAVVSLINGSLECQRRPELKDKLLGIIMDAREGSPRMPINGTSLPGKAIMSSQPKKPGNGALVKPGAVITEEDIRNYLCPNASPQEILMAAKMCQLRGMNWGDVHFIKYGNSPLTIVAGKEHFTKKAEANTQFDGFKAGIIVRGKDGSLQEREGTFYLDEELVGGWASVWRKDRKEPFVQKVRLSAFDTKKALWAKMPEVMIRKCALVNALREAFPGDLGGVYDSSEMGQAIDADFEEMGAA